MVLPDGTPKGLKMVLEERGVDVRKMKREGMVAKLSSFDDFKNGKNKVQRLLARFEIRAFFLLKFHPELNPIERVWGKAKVYTRDRCDYSFPSLQRMVTPALASVSLDQMRKYFRRDYVNAFKDGHTGYKADKVIKDYIDLIEESLKLRVWCNEQLMYFDFIKSFAIYNIYYIMV